MWLVNWWRVRHGRPARNMSERELRRRLLRSDSASREAGMELAKLAQDADALGLPMPFEPTTVVNGIIVHRTLGVMGGKPPTNAQRHRHVG